MIDPIPLDTITQLAGVSVDYLNRLERGRGARPSDAVLGALARALRLSTVEHDHLFHLAGGPRRALAPEADALALLRVLGLQDMGAATR